MGRAMVARLGLGLLLLSLLLPTQIYSNQTTAVTPSSNSSQQRFHISVHGISIHHQVKRLYVVLDSYASFMTLS
ncbi:hypothetical protein J1605_014977 [Eschrichtius robustus]|uniref:Uncharacterized protein n=1 Tax=Eschrichtius robustus TaxID=9764 RepID=A0AB34GF45_ESCRO|nr:hypothetical protein J1605_014977 [Eschrichtius robustus]